MKRSEWDGEKSWSISEKRLLKPGYPISCRPAGEARMSAEKTSGGELQPVKEPRVASGNHDSPILIPKPAACTSVSAALRSKAFLTLFAARRAGKERFSSEKNAVWRAFRLSKNPLRESASVHTAAFVRRENAVA